MYALSCFTCKSRIFYAKSLTGRTSRTIYVRSCYKRFQQIDKIFQKIDKDSNPFFSFLAPSITSIMRSEQVNSSQPSRGVLKKRSGTSAPISLEDLMEKEVQSSSQDSAIRELSVLADPSNEHRTNIKRKIRILDHPKNLIEVL